MTERAFFQGDPSFIKLAKSHSRLPVLRKDFIIDEYQVIESKSIGADAILLIGAILTKQKVKALASLAVSLKMEVLYEVHDAVDVDKLCPEIAHVGINNRNLETFDVDIDNALKLAAELPEGVIKIAESGISNAEQLLQFKKHGYQGFLIGEQFMKDSRPGQACKKFIRQLNALQYVS